jgi:hypothetical protein
MRRAALLVVLLAAGAGCNDVLGIPEVTHHIDGGGGNRPDAGLVCPLGQKNCSGTCVAADDPQTGCGGESCAPCTYAHASAVCDNGACAMGDCTTGFGDCDTSPDNGCELPTSADPKNCGGCGTVCAGGLHCVKSNCGCVTASDCGSTAACSVPACVCNGTTCGQGIPCNGSGDCAN